MKFEIQPSKDQIDHWIKAYVPEKDLFYLREKDLITFENHLHNVLIIPKEEFFEHASYKQIQLVNSYEYWNLSKEVEFIIVATPDWFINLSVQKKMILNSIQLEVGRGLVFPVSLRSNRDSIPEENIVEADGKSYVVLQSDMWKTLPNSIKETLIKEYASQWDKWTCYDFSKRLPFHLKKYANTFPLDAGSNCLSATLFAISQQEWIIYEWVHPKTFVQGLKRCHYSIKNKEELYAGDVVTWENTDGIIQHASYHIGDNLFFNKNGQTFFNPWKVVDWSELKEEWSNYSITIYRKNA